MLGGELFLSTWPFIRLLYQFNLLSNKPPKRLLLREEGRGLMLNVIEGKVAKKGISVLHYKEQGNGDSST